MNPFYEDVLTVKEKLEADRNEVLTGADRLQSLSDKLCSCGLRPEKTAEGLLKVSLGEGDAGICLIAKGDPGVMLGAVQMLKNRETFLKGRIDVFFAEQDADFDVKTLDGTLYSAGLCLDSVIDGAEDGGFQCITDITPRRYQADYTLTATAPKGLRGVNPITMTARMQVAVSELIASEFALRGVSAVSLEWNGGTAPNAGAESAALRGRITAPSQRICQEVRERIEVLGEKIAAAFRASYSSEWKENPCAKGSLFGLCTQLTGYLGDAVGWEHMKLFYTEQEEASQDAVPVANYRYILEEKDGSFALSLAVGAAACANCAVHYLKSRSNMTGGDR